MTQEQTVEWGEVLPLMTDSWKDLPNSNTPYYVVAADGTYLHRKTALGRGIVRHTKTPAKLKRTGFFNGNFVFEANEIPATIYAQAVSFFKRIWDEHKTEAEVIITQHRETLEYRLFIPHQRVSHGGVYSIYNPRHIDPMYLVVGTFHSHCNFNPYHSSTDEGDARDMDGIHGTIGYLDREVPEMALMVAMNGQMFHFKEPFTDVVDTTDLNAMTAPRWWDTFVLFGTITDADRERIAPYAEDIDWEKFMGRYRKPVPVPVQQPWQGKGYQPKPTPGLRNVLSPREQQELGIGEQSDEFWAEHNRRVLAENGYIWDPEARTYRWRGTQITKESAEFNERRGMNPNPLWGDDGELLAEEEEADSPDYWEDQLGSDFINALFDTDLLTDEDLEAVVKNHPLSGTPEYWESFMRSKIVRAAQWLDDHGYDVQVSIKPIKVKALPGQTTMEQHISGEIYQ